MYWYRPGYGRRWGWGGWYPPYQPAAPQTPEDELRFLEEYKRQLEQDIRELEEELRSVEERIKELRKAIKEGKPLPAAQPPPPPPPPPAWGPGWGWGMGPGPRWAWGANPYMAQPPGYPAYPQAAQPIAAPQLPPPPPDGVRVVAPVEEDRGLDSRVAGVFARAPFLAVVDVAGGKAAEVRVVPNPYAGAPGGAGPGLVEWVLGTGARVVVAPGLGVNAARAAEAAGLRVVSVEPGATLREALKKAGLISE